MQIHGPAGIGKTALVEQFLDEIALADRLPDERPAAENPASVIVLRASGEETEELLAYGVLDQLAARSPGPGSAKRPGPARSLRGRRTCWSKWSPATAPTASMTR